MSITILPLAALILRTTLVAILSTTSSAHGSLVLSFGLCVPKIYFSAIDLCDGDLVNQFTGYCLINVSHKTEAPTLPTYRVSHNLGLLYLPKLAKVHSKLTVSQCIVKTANKYFISHPRLIVLVTASWHAISRPTPVAKFVLLGHPIAVGHYCSLLFITEVATIVSPIVLATSVILLAHLHLPLIKVTKLLLTRRYLIKKRVSRLVAITFTDLYFSVLDDVW